MNKYCVYVHRRNDTGKVFYVGSGTKERSQRKSHRSLHWKSITGSTSYSIEYLAEDLLKHEASTIETNLLKSPPKDWALCNKINSSLVKDIDFKMVESMLYYDESSPSCLRWKEDSLNNKFKAGDSAGSLSKAGYYQVKLNRVLYQGHRLVYLLVNGTLDPELVVNHIDYNRSNNHKENLEQVTYQINNIKSKVQLNKNCGVSFVTSCGKEYAKCRYVDFSGKRVSKYFLCNDDRESAFNLALEFRAAIMKELYGIITH